MSISAPFIAPPDRHLAAGHRGAAGAACWAIGRCPSPPCRRWISPTILVTTQLPGANPDTVATLITASLERQFGQIQGLTTMTSTSSEGTSQITLQFSLDRSIDSAAQDVQAAINAAAGTLPATLPYPPVYAKVNPADAPILTLALMSDAVTIDRVSDAADTLLQPKLSQIDGVGRVTVQGNMRPAVRVRVDPARLAAYGLAMEDVRTAVAAANVNGAKGGFDGPRQAFALGANDQLVSPDAYRDLVDRLAQRRRRCGCPTSAAWSAGWRTTASAPGTIRRTAGAAIRRCCSTSSASPAPTSCRRWTGSRRRCPPCSAPCRRPSAPSWSPTAPRRSAPASPTCRPPWCCRSCWWWG